MHPEEFPEMGNGRKIVHISSLIMQPQECPCSYDFSTQWWLHSGDTDDCQNCFSRKEDVCRDRRAVSPYPLSGDPFHGHFQKPSSVHHVIKVYVMIYWIFCF